MKLKDYIWALQERVRQEVHHTAEDERGEFGIKQLAITVAAIVIIGFVITFMQGNMDTILQEVWDWLFDTIQGMVGAP